MNAPAKTPKHPWIVSLQAALDMLESALLRGDASGVEQASVRIQSTLQTAPKTAEFAVPGSTLRTDMAHAAQRFGQLRQAVWRANAQTQRAVTSVLQQPAPPTYAHPVGSGNAISGAGQSFLSA